MKSISIYLKVQMPIARTTVAGATAVASQFVLIVSRYNQTP